MCTKIEWIDIKIYNVKKWGDNLFSIKFNANIDSFIPGQFGRIKINYLNKNFIRAYSYINSPYNKNLEFYIKRIDSGIVSNILYNISNNNINDNNIIKISKKSYGILTLDNIVDCKNLWMFATGTGIGPYLSILKTKINLKKINKIILVYSVKFLKNINYFYSLKKIKKKMKENFININITTQEKSKYTLNNRIPELIKNGNLEKLSRSRISTDDFFMICGNPEMINDTKYCLKKIKNINSNKIIFEKYWK